ncbi:MAG: EamA family transporter RarD [Phycisphaerales bacterium]|nr:EamA family transporter RarD [Phycisphaerales bacterium]
MEPELTARPRDQATTGVLLALGAYGWWGAVTPLYYHQLQEVPVLELIAWRVLAGLPIMMVLLWAISRHRELLRVLWNPRVMGLLAVSAVLIGINWFVFIIAVDTNRLTQASLGYYINPLVSVALGMLVLGERMRLLQWIAIIIAAIGVTVLAIKTGGVPWISLSLAGSFAFYGLIRKQVDTDAATGLTVEMILLFPFMLAVLVFVHTNEGTMMADGETWLVVMLLLGGPITIVPLLLFTGCARRLRLATVGLMQYIAPTGQFLMGVLAFGEAFGADRIVAFCLIWAAVILYSTDAWRHARREQVVTIPD